ncbi:HAD family hydrolase [Streptomyces sp. NPDC003943]
MSISLVLFDLDSTLIDRQIGLDSWVREFSTVRELPEPSARVISDILRARAHPQDFVRVKLALGLADSVDSLWRSYVSGMAQQVHCYDGVLDGLRSLKADGWSIGIATNGAPDIQYAKLDGAGLSELVDGVCASGEVGRRKPDRTVFEVAARRCGARLEDGGWMVGDNPSTDMEGGRAAGLRTLWVSGERQWPEGVESPDVAVPDVRAAVGHLAKWGRSRSPQLSGAM